MKKTAIIIIASILIISIIVFAAPKKEEIIIKQELKESAKRFNNTQATETVCNDGICGLTLFKKGIINKEIYFSGTVTETFDNITVLNLTQEVCNGSECHNETYQEIINNPYSVTRNLTDIEIESARSAKIKETLEYIADKLEQREIRLGLKKYNETQIEII